MGTGLCSVGVRRVVLDTADTDTVGDTDLDVTMVTPVPAPGVLDNVEVGAVTNSEDGVVGRGSAVRGGDDTSRVVFK